MASIRLEMNLRADPWNVWDAVRDVGAIHTRLSPDFVANVAMDGDARIVTFANGMTAKELIVDVDDAGGRLVRGGGGGRAPGGGAWRGVWACARSGLRLSPRSMWGLGGRPGGCSGSVSCGRAVHAPFAH